MLFVQSIYNKGVVKRFWRNLHILFMASHGFRSFVVMLITSYLRFVYWTNPLIKGSHDPRDAHGRYNPFIITFWHGRHIMGPFLRPKGESIVAMFSRSVDAELNALVGEKLGLKTVRGSGGREKYRPEKGGARALLKLKKALRSCMTVAMIADIAHGRRREAGKGIILLSKLSGRPIIPYVYAFSREKILRRTWDQTAIPLPFGRSIFLMGEVIYVPSDADEGILEGKRIELTLIMNALMEQAYLRLKKNR
ncbi:MAG: hypothetical protein JSC161_000343 [Candidatus Tokpelaia sp. JSC161]|jgi:hypothetical protein|nr:MAG: hypothetical protein JSC161_000343 [Candidatus Tokpelaia sp. JSC161]